MSSSDQSQGEQNTAEPIQEPGRRRRGSRRGRRRLQDAANVATIIGLIVTIIGLLVAVIVAILQLAPSGRGPTSGHSPTATALVPGTTPSATASSVVPTNTPGGPVLPTSTPKLPPTATPTPTDTCFLNHNGSDGHGYTTTHIADYAALLGNDSNEITVDQNYIRNVLGDCTRHQASTVRVYGGYPSGGDQGTALAIANKIISPLLQNLGADQFIFINASYSATTNAGIGSYDYAIIEIVWRN